MTTNGIRQVQHYANILEALQRAILGSVHIAGGAVRDTILGRPIRDIDIFLHHTAGDLAAALLRTEFGYVKVGEWVQYEHFSDPMLVRVAKFEKADETIPVCLIGLAEDLSPHDNIARFDFGVCMAAWQGGSTLMITAAHFKRDIESKTFTLRRADNLAQFSYSMVRFEKLTADRYKDWQLLVPSQFEALAKEHAFRRHWYSESGAHFGIENYPQLLRPKHR
jgi:Poly A polymerase head domain